MPKKFEDILNECLDRIARGEDIEQCLADYPDEAGELRPLLQTASTLNTIDASIQPRPEFKAQSRQRFMAEVRAREQEKQKPGWISFFEWQRRWAFAAVALLLVVVIGGGTTVAASTNAMPDDFLYPVKLAVENVRLTFAGSDVDKAELEAKFANERVNEIRKMAQKENWAKVEATAERLSGHLQKISEVAVKKISQGTITEQDISKLRRTLTAFASEHPIIFEKALAMTPQEDKSIIRRVLTESQDYLVTAVENFNIAVRQNPEVASIADNSFDGYVRTITADGKWMVGNEVVSIDSSTVVNGTPQIGASAKIEIRVQSDGSLRASSVEFVSVNQNNSETDVAVVQPVPSISTEVIPEITDPEVVTPKPDSNSTATPESEIKPSPAVTPVRTPTVESEDKPDISVAVVPTETIEEQSGQETIVSSPVVFDGTVKRITEGAWLVGDRIIFITDDTEIIGDPAVNQSATLWIVIRSDGSLLAQKVEFEKTNTVTPGATDVIEPSNDESFDQSGPEGHTDSTGTSNTDSTNVNSVTGK